MTRKTLVFYEENISRWMVYRPYFRTNSMRYVSSGLALQNTCSSSPVLYFFWKAA